MKRLFNTIDEWKIIQDKIEFEENRLAESIMSIGNGYMGMRGNYEEYYSKDSHRGSYTGGVWYPDKTRVGWWKNGYPNYFDFIADASKCKNSKPAPDIFLMALNGLNVEAKNCIGIEDAYSGIEAINTSGMYSVGVGDKETLKNANLVVEDTTYLEFDTLMDIFNK